MSAPFRTAVEAANLDAMVACLSPDVVFHSPVTFKPFLGRDAVGALLGIVADTFQDFAYTDEIATGDTTALIFTARVGDRKVEGMDLLRHDADGKIADFTVMVRPLSAVNALAEAIGARLGVA